jgi:hypothetical protein
MLRQNVELPDEATFYDVHPEHWAFAEVSNLVTQGVISGYPDGYFRPESNVTRAEAAKIIATAFPNDSETDNMTYRDTEDHWANKFIRALNGVLPLQENETDHFRPDEYTTREEVVVALVNTLDLSNGTSMMSADNIVDYGAVRSDLSSEFLTGIEKGIIEGYADGTYRPASNITRAEMAMIIYRMLSQ